MPSDDPPPKKNASPIDVTTIEFPSDRVTLRDMRLHEPEMFAGDVIFDVTLFEVEAIAAHRIEVRLAERAALPRRTAEDPQWLRERQELIGTLGDFYARYGISEGIHQTRLLVEQFERTAASQVSGRA